MKSLVRSAQSQPKADHAVPAKATAPSLEVEEAQCCAKVSKTVAGCHD